MYFSLQHKNIEIPEDNTNIYFTYQISDLYFSLLLYTYAA
jgi:hypothetical protein